jgi:hypothetical protein
MSVPYSGPLADLVKTAEAAKGRKESMARLASAPASTLPRLVVNPLVVSSERTDCDRIEGDSGVSSCFHCSCEPCNPNE